MSILQFSIVMLALLTVYMGNRILKRLPSHSAQTQLVFGGLGGQSFAVWVDVAEYCLEEFVVGHVDHWICGPSFSAWGDADADPYPDVKRATFKFHSVRNALSESNIIGWAKVTENRVQLNISLTADVANNLLYELRASPKPHLHAQGSVGQDGSIKLHYLCLTPGFNV